MAKLLISPEARDDLHSIKEYITTELGSPIAASNTVFKITKAIRNLTRNPAMGVPLASIVTIPNDYRFLVCGNYLVFYRQEGSNVLVVRILYGRRDYTKILFGSMPDSNEPVEQFNAEIAKGITSLEASNTIPVQQVRE
jgi:plasmid stabilization system protein ParE